MELSPFHSLRRGESIKANCAAESTILSLMLKFRGEMNTEKVSNSAASTCCHWQGDLDGQAAWLRILRAVKELLQAQPDIATQVYSI